MNNTKPNKKPLRYLSPLHRISRQIQDHLDLQARAVGVSGTEAHLLSYLGSYAPVAVGNLVRVFGLRKSTLTGMLDRLEKSSLIERSLHPTDRRSLLVDLTSEGQVVAQEIRGQLESFEAALDRELAPHGEKALNGLLKAVNRITKSEEEK